MPTPKHLLGALLLAGAFAGGPLAAGTQARTSAAGTRCGAIAIDLGAGARAQFSAITARGVSCRTADAILGQYANAGPGSRISGFSCSARSHQSAGLTVSNGACVSGARRVSFTESAPTS